MVDRVHPRRGATAVEFALVSIVLFMFLFGLIEFTRISMLQHAVHHAARQGARLAALPTVQSASVVESSVRGSLQSAIRHASDPSIVAVNVTPSNLTAAVSGTAVTVDVRANFADVSWLPFPFFTKNVQIRANVSKTRE